MRHEIYGDTKEMVLWHQGVVVMLVESARRGGTA